MAVWQFTKEGDISNGEHITPFQQLVETIERTNSNSVDIISNDMGETLVQNDLVYIDQEDGKYYKSFNTGLANQAQNAIGVYRYLYDKHQIVFTGLINGFSNLIPGKFYYLSSTPGVAVAATSVQNVMVGRAINSTTLLLEISGDTNVSLSSGYDTSIVDGETAEGNSLTDPSTTMTLSYAKLAYDASTPAVIMFVRADGIDAKIDYASEYTGAAFTIMMDGVTYVGNFSENENFSTPTILVVDGTTVVEPDPVIEEPVLVNDTVTLTATTTVVEGGTITYTASVVTTPTSTLTINLSNGKSITIATGATSGSVTDIAPSVSADTNVTVSITGTSGGTYDSLNTTDTATTLVTDTVVVDPVDPVVTTYDTSVTDGVFAEGISLTDPSLTATLSYDAKTFDASVPAVIMFAMAGEVSIKIDYATEYTGRPFAVTIAGATYSGVFAENESYSTPTILN